MIKQGRSRDFSNGGCHTASKRGFSSDCHVVFAPVEGCFLKREGHCKELTFLSLAVVRHLAFSLTEVPADKVSSRKKGLRRRPF